MDHPQAHAHPSLSSRDNRGHQQLSRQRPFGLSHTPSPIRQQRTEANVTPQQRRLQLRNAGFRGAHVSTNSLSKKFSRLFHGNEEAQSAPAPAPGRKPVRKQENSTPARRIRPSRSLNTTLGILNEITNSTRSRHRQPIPVFEDNPERPLLEDSPMPGSPNFYDALSSPLVAAEPTGGHDKMHLNEVSGNAWRSPPQISDTSSESPKYPSPQVSRRQRSGMRKSSPRSPDYTAHIEDMLQAVRAQAHSPQTGLPFKAKFEAAKMENRKLKQMIQDLEGVFEEKVKEAVEHMTTTEVELRRRIKNLEDELEQKDDTIQELEYQHSETRMDFNVVDALKATIEKLELQKQSLEDANRSVEKRNEVLTQLLAMSPTKAQQGFALSSPVRDSNRRTPRPRSMLIPKLPSSPSMRYGSRPQSVIASPAMSPDYFGGHAALAEELEALRSPHQASSPQKLVEDLHSIDSGLGESCSLKGASGNSSRRSTIASQGSMSPSSWELPSQISPPKEDGTFRQPTRRKTRRFMSGSTQLKPLLLPSMTGEVGQIQILLPSLVPLPLSPARRYISEESIDPTTSFLSKPCDSPSQLSNAAVTWLTEEPRSFLEEERSLLTQVAPEAKEDDDDPESVHCMIEPPDNTVRTIVRFPLETDSPQYEDDSIEEEVTVILDPGSPELLRKNARQIMVGEFNALSAEPKLARERDFDLEMPAIYSLGNSRRCISQIIVNEDRQLSNQQSKPIFSSTTGKGFSAGVDDYSQDEHAEQISRSVDASPTPNPRKRRMSNLSSGIRVANISTHVESSDMCFQSPPEARKVLTPKLVSCKSVASDLCPNTADLEAQSPQKPIRSMRSMSPLELLQRSHAGPKPLAAAAIRTVYGTMSHYTTYIREIKHDPLALARRVIANAWCTNWKRLGKLSWWVLGLFLGPAARKDYTRRLEGERWNWDDYDAECIAERVHAEEEGERPTSSNEAQQSDESARRVRFDDQSDRCRSRGSRSDARPASKSGKGQKIGWGKSLFLWGKFSVAILLAVGGAVVKGPAEMLKDCDDQGKTAEIQGDRLPERVARPTNTKNSLGGKARTFNFSMDFSENDFDPSGGSTGVFGGSSPPQHPNVRVKSQSPPRRHAPAYPEISPTSTPRSCSKMFTFGSSYEAVNSGDSANAETRPRRARIRNICPPAKSRDLDAEYDPTSPGLSSPWISQKPTQPKEDEELDGTLEWMQNLTIEDFEHAEQTGPDTDRIVSLSDMSDTRLELEEKHLLDDPGLF